MAWMLVAWGVAERIHDLALAARQRPEPTFMVASSSIHIEKKNHPVPRVANPQPNVHEPQPKEQVQTKPQPEHTAQPKAQPTELARIDEHAPPQPRSAQKRQEGTLAEQLAQQQAAFAHEAQQLNAQNGPISIATIDPSQRESATKSYSINFSGIRGLEGKGEGYLDPLRRWRNDDGQNCYYGRYTWLYPAGGTEVANIPWAFCFYPSQDPIAHGIRQFPFPLPETGYRLPPGTYLAPIEKEVYQGWLSQQ
jgi:hypothetical protein